MSFTELRQWETMCSADPGTQSKVTDNETDFIWAPEGNPYLFEIFPFLQSPDSTKGHARFDTVNRRWQKHKQMFRMGFLTMQLCFGNLQEYITKAYDARVVHYSCFAFSSHKASPLHVYHEVISFSCARCSLTCPFTPAFLVQNSFDSSLSCRSCDVLSKLLQTQDGSLERTNKVLSIFLSCQN